LKPLNGLEAVAKLDAPGSDHGSSHAGNGRH
jgi:hypothetical protein